MTTIKLANNIRTIGILSDSHGFIDSRVLQALEAVDVVLHAGDIMDKSVLEMLEKSQRPLYCVRGNNDHELAWPQSSHARLEKIPESLQFELNGDLIALIHGHQFGHHQPDYEQLKAHFPDCRLIIYGHTHKQVVNTHSNPWIINPGASGRVRTKGGPSCLILHIDRHCWRIQTVKFVDDKIAA